MRERAANAFLRMHASMNQANLFLTPRSGFRSYETQRVLFNNAVQNRGLAHAERWIARPGHSEHQTGLAIDIVQRGFTGSPLSNARFQNTLHFAWLQQHAHTYGFILRYPQSSESITGFAFEPWHWRYIGVESAAYMRENGFVIFETYIAHRATRPTAPIGPSSWAIEQVNAAIAAGFVPAHLQSHYTNAITRAEFTALVVALYESTRGEIQGRVSFIDTDDENVRKAAYIGVVAGVGNNRFDPNAELTREQAAVMLSRLADALDQPLPREAASFADNNSISHWAADAVGRVQVTEVMIGLGDNRFAPQGGYTREQAIVTMMRLFHVTRPPSFWATEQINAAIAAGLVPAHLQFRYTDAITRAEFTALVVALYENTQGEIHGRVSFIDTNDENVRKAAYIGVVAGVGNNRFDPNAELTREQAAVMLSRLADTIGQPLPREATSFADEDSISPWAMDAVGRVQASGLMFGVGNHNFAPQGGFTREQAIVTMMRLFLVFGG